MFHGFLYARILLHNLHSWRKWTQKMIGEIYYALVSSRHNSHKISWRECQWPAPQLLATGWRNWDEGVLFACRGLRYICILADKGSIWMRWADQTFRAESLTLGQIGPCLFGPQYCVIVWASTEKVFNSIVSYGQIKTIMKV